MPRTRPSDIPSASYPDRTCAGGAVSENTFSEQYPSQPSPVGDSCLRCNPPFTRPRRRATAPLLRSMASFSAARPWRRSYSGPFSELTASASVPSCCSTLVGSRKDSSASCSAPSTILKTRQVCAAFVVMYTVLCRKTVYQQLPAR